MTVYLKKVVLTMLITLERIFPFTKQEYIYKF